MGFEDDMADGHPDPVNAPVFCPGCNTKLIEGDNGNRVCTTNFPPCCYLYWNALEKKHHWKEGFGPEDVYDTGKKTWQEKRAY